MQGNVRPKRNLCLKAKKLLRKTFYSASYNLDHGFNSAERASHWPVE